MTLFDRAFDDTIKLFTGQHPGYLPIDLGYHNLEHTLQATVCLGYILQGAQLSADGRTLTSRQFELAIVTALLHDTGYLKLRSDLNGTGAKYTLTHVLRSCAFSASYLPTIGAEAHEISGVLNAINCTGPTNEIGRLHFTTPADRFIGCAVGTADYLGQMAANDYPDKLGILYGEFLESDNFVGTPAEKRMFKSPQDLAQKTPDFWTKFVQPRLVNQLDRTYRYLSRPLPDGPNEYLDAVEKNISIVRQRLKAG
ncbi:MAG: hypothetical protein JWM32_2598 [Verrucomicrobia bacterium]|nr:hypothetical protein [Verrucomicrobiota bacterium]